jgi:hypothetical protein
VVIPTKYGITVINDDRIFFDATCAPKISQTRSGLGNSGAGSRLTWLVVYFVAVFPYRDMGETCLVMKRSQLPISNTGNKLCKTKNAPVQEHVLKDAKTEDGRPSPVMLMRWKTTASSP